ncbi:chloride intracellular channel exc-4-like [Drosophila persimilis]|uniref:chloride intracellular channel exc-4-like n=1 Tax=Drosophila persimilis TaxID=7234 RepID=UPI000F0790E9|nr:chloride intracellular channel exc-4-like [Drosophila persimilis]
MKPFPVNLFGKATTLVQLKATGRPLLAAERRYVSEGAIELEPDKDIMEYMRNYSADHYLLTDMKFTAAAIFKENNVEALFNNKWLNTAPNSLAQVMNVLALCFEATHPPILIDNGLAILENEKIERHIMKNIPGGYNLFVQDKEVATLIENLYVKLKLMLVKKDDAKNNVLLSHLKKINDHLANRNTRFLTGDTMCCFDCELMPRLQHIRVAGKYFVDFEIPTHLTALWRYMYHMYQLDAFWIRPPHTAQQQ